jgi:hypothetical protein
LRVPREFSIVNGPADEHSGQQASDRRRAMRARLIDLRDDHDALDRAYFQALSPGERMAMVWSMFVEQWRLKGGDAEQLRLRRDVACLQRGKR